MKVRSESGFLTLKLNKFVLLILVIFFFLLHNTQHHKQFLTIRSLQVIWGPKVLTLTVISKQAASLYFGEIEGYAWLLKTTKNTNQIHNVCV